MPDDALSLASSGLVNHGNEEFGKCFRNWRMLQKYVHNK
jgi:hypothetical protein